MFSTVSWPILLRVSMSESDNVEFEEDMSDGAGPWAMEASSTGPVSQRHYITLRGASL